VIPAAVIPAAKDRKMSRRRKPATGRKTPRKPPLQRKTPPDHDGRDHPSRVSEDSQQTAPRPLPRAKPRIGLLAVAILLQLGWLTFLLVMAWRSATEV
jgi:hypothetical protein